MALTLAKTLRLLAAEKKAVLQRQTALVASLNKLLPSIGYRVVPLEGEGRAGVRSSLPARRPATAKLLTNRPLICPHCNRTFALPLHLGRHMSVMHRAKRASTPLASSADGGDRPAVMGEKPIRTSRGQGTWKASARRRRVRSTRTATKTPRKAATAKPAKG